MEAFKEVPVAMNKPVVKGLVFGVFVGFVIRCKAIETFFDIKSASNGSMP